MDYRADLNVQVEELFSTVYSESDWSPITP